MPCDSGKREESRDTVSVAALTAKHAGTCLRYLLLALHTLQTILCSTHSENCNVYKENELLFLSLVKNKL